MDNVLFLFLENFLNLILKKNEIKRNKKGERFKNTSVAIKVFSQHILTVIVIFLY